jgi:glucose/arabinose dehydrogenase
VTQAGDGSNRLFVVEQTGRIWIVQEGERLSGPFIDLSDRVSQDVLSGYSERGLLGLAFDPNYAENGQFYVNYTDRNGTTHLSRFVVSADNPDLTDRSTEERLLTIEQFARNHNGGHLAFGPDGYLYMAVGDGGAAGDPMETGQRPSDLLGSILRIDVTDVEGDQPYAIPEDNPYSTDDSFAPEVWSYGLRNPWRFSFDRATDDLYIADVGQNQYEEVNFQPADSSGGENYGWDVFEGEVFYEGWMGEPQVETVDPIAVYDHGQGCSVTGGYVYRGELVPELQAAYLYSDYCSGNIWAAYRDANGSWQSGLIMETGTGISSFGEDEAGELYVLDYSGGRLLQFTPTTD